MKDLSFFPANYLDLIFQNRNKAYGAYLLRKEYPNTILKSMGIILLPLCFAFAISFFKKSEKIEQQSILPPIIYNPTHPNIKIIPDHPTNPISTVTHTKTNIHTNIIPHIVSDNIVKEEKETPSATTVNTSTTIDNSKTNVDGENSSAVTGGSSVIPTNTSLENFETKPIHYATEMPSFNGDINLYLSNHLRYPEMAKTSNIQGKVTIEFVVSEDGSISQVKIVKGIGGGCDEEAMNVVKNMPKWKPGKQNGTPVKVYCVIPISFVLN